MNTLFKQIPQVAKLLADPQIKALNQQYFQVEIKAEIETYLNELRDQIKQGLVTEVDYHTVINEITQRIKKRRVYSLQRVINGTGTIVHTNLGRSLLSQNALNHVIEMASHYSNLEYDLDKGERGSRYVHVEKMVAKLIGSEAALVVNNNAAATLLCVAAFGQHKEVIVSRGELVEIGGSFRIPEIIELSQAKLREVGTTNRTHLFDYERATTDETAMYLKVHPSNYAMQGFTKSVSNEELVQLAQRMNENRSHKIITMEDLGSGVLVKLPEGLQEKTVQEAVNSGMDLVTFSGDKLLGGPQAGIIVGKKYLIDQIKKHPLTRALRVDKMTIAALEGTLRDYLDLEVAKQSIPTLRMIYQDVDELCKLSYQLTEKINQLDNGFSAKVIFLKSTIGGGALPLSEIPSFGVSIQSTVLSTEAVEKYLRHYRIPIIGRIVDNKYVIDCRTLLEGDMEIIFEALKGWVK